MLSRRRLLALGAAAPAAWSADSSNNVPLRTHEWFGDRVEMFEFPSGWQIDVRNMNGWQTPVLPAAEIRRAIENPVGSKPLREIAAGKKTAAIAFDDLTRPTPTHDVVPYVLAELNAAGIRDENILFVTGHGCHYKMNGMEVEKKLGTDAVRRCDWINHNVWENLEDRGVSRAGNQILINTYYAKADVKITLSGLKEHGTPGYGGGPKLILPGVSGIKTIRFMHETLKQSPRPRVDSNGTPIFHVWQNEQRQDMIDAARHAGVDFSVQMVCNQDRRLVHVVAGDIVRAHHRAARYAVKHLATEFSKDADIVVVNAYPKGAQLHEHFGWGTRGLKPGGSIVVVNQNPLGELVWHYLDEARFNKGQSWTAQRDQRKRRFPQAGQVIIYSQYLQRRELDNPYFPPEAQGVRSWPEVVAALRQQHKSDAKVAIYPYVGIQHGPAVLDIPDSEC